MEGDANARDSQRMKRMLYLAIFAWCVWSGDATAQKTKDQEYRHLLFLKAEASACQPLFTYPSTFSPEVKVTIT